MENSDSEITKHQWMWIYITSFVLALILGAVLKFFHIPLLYFIAAFSAFMMNNLLDGEKKKAKIQLFAIIGAVIGTILCIIVQCLIK